MVWYETSVKDYVIFELHRITGMDWCALIVPEGPCILRLTNPLNMDHVRLKEMSIEWFVTKKCDGKRALVVILIFSKTRFKLTIDRQCKINIISHTPTNDTNDGIEFAFDCEHMHDGKYICHDVLVYERVSVLFRDFCQRLKYIYKLKELVDMPIPKKFYPVSAIKMISEGDSDGYIFIHCNAQFTPGQSNCILKWKPLNRISIDLFVSENLNIQAISKGQYVPFTQTICEYELSLHECKGRITEFFFDGKAWFPALIRDDKNVPNNLHVVIETVRSAKAPVSRAQLFQTCENLK